MNANELDSAPSAAPLRVPGGLAAARFLLTVLVGLAAVSLPQLYQRGDSSGHTLGNYSLLWVVLLTMTGLLALLELAGLILLWTGVQRRLGVWAERILNRLASLRGWNWIGVLAPWLAYVLLVLYRYQKHFTDFIPQVWLFGLMVGIGAFFLVALRRKTPYFAALTLIAIFYGAGVKALGYLPDISSFPFSMGWSEASRYYYASLPFSRSLYGEQFPLSFLHPSRYLLQSLPYLIPGSTLLVSRAWQVFLWLALSLLTGYALARRVKKNWLVTLPLTVWAALFLLQGPVYYHLTLCLILILWTVDARRFWKTLIFVLLASLWAGISRVNWFPVPAMLAAVLYLLEKPLCSIPGDSKRWQTWARYLWPPLAWGLVGMAGALASQAAYVLVSGHEDAAGTFGSSFSSSLLWYRLLPSATSGLGVLPIALIVSAPLLLLVGGTWLRGREDWHWMRILGMTAMVGVLFAGGLVVSTKIGGGSNIHNVDAYFSLLLVMGCQIGFGRFASEAGTPVKIWRPWPLVLAIVLLPVMWNINIGDPFVRRDFKQANFDLDKLNKIVQQYAPKGEVLFITQRQVEIFNLVQGVKMVPDYELLTLSEMAISNNHVYLDHFYEDLRNHRFVLIISDEQQANMIRNPAWDAFAEENNAWVENISRPVLAYYGELMFFDTQGIQLLVPKQLPTQ